MKVNNQRAFTILTLTSFAVVLCCSQVISAYPDISALIAEQIQSSNRHFYLCSFRKDSMLKDWINLSMRFLIIISFPSIGITGYYSSLERYLVLYRKYIVIFLSMILLISLLAVSGVSFASSISDSHQCAS
jgi:hypothetical protein